ncbi:MAG: Hsp20/alpha crystallin family protein [Planctomycetia bacterium]|nr:Hsp20/alpha crystallin family protein [Planctomycetia bacterium]
MTTDTHPEKNGASQIPVTHAPGPAEAPPPLPPEVAPAERALFTPPIDIYESDEGLVLIADLPGVSVGSLELQVQNNKLTLLGRVASQVPAGARQLHKEYEEGDFLRSFILSEDVDHERVSARLNNGVLEVVLPRAPKSAPRRIQVNGD